LKLLHLTIPKLGDIFLTLDFNESDLVPFFRLEVDLPLALLFNELLVLFPLLLDFLEKAVVGFPALVASTLDVGGSIHSDVFEDATIVACLILDILVVFVNLG
jgi:hypothetical protein